jgi:hypothetical protein
MPFSLSWDDIDKSVVHILATGEWSIEEFRVMVNHLVRMIRTVSHPVYTLVDARESAMPPIGIIWNARYAFQSLPPNYRGSAFVTHDPFFANVVETLNVLYAEQVSHFIAVRTMDEGRQAIKKWLSEGS